MSNFKEGEGTVMISPAPFTCGDIKAGEQYLIVVLAGTDVVEVSRADATGTVTSDSRYEMHLYLHGDGTITLLSKSRVFMTRYVEHWDVIIKDSDGMTVKMLPNVSIIHG